MAGTWAVLCAMGALWMVGQADHTPNPTWGQLWGLVIAWAVIDIAILVVKGIRSKARSTGATVESG